MTPSKLFIQDELGIAIPIYDLDMGLKPRVIDANLNVVPAESRLVPLFKDLSDTEDNIVLKMLCSVTEPRTVTSISDAVHLASKTFSDFDLEPRALLSHNALNILGLESFTDSSLSPDILFITAGAEYTGFVVRKYDKVGFLLHNPRAVLQFKIQSN